MFPSLANFLWTQILSLHCDSSYEVFGRGLLWKEDSFVKHAWCPVLICFWFTVHRWFLESSHFLASIAFHILTKFLTLLWVIIIISKSDFRVIWHLYFPKSLKGLVSVLLKIGYNIPRWWFFTLTRKEEKDSNGELMSIDSKNNKKINKAQPEDESFFDGASDVHKKKIEKF